MTPKWLEWLEPYLIAYYTAILTRRRIFIVMTDKQIRNHNKAIKILYPQETQPHAPARPIR